MYKFIFLLFVSFSSGVITAQVKDPVKWTASSKKKGDNYDVILTATLPKPWHIYSQKTGEGPCRQNSLLQKISITSDYDNSKYYT